MNVVDGAQSFMLKDWTKECGMTKEQLDLLIIYGCQGGVDAQEGSCLHLLVSSERLRKIFLPIVKT